MYNFLRSTSSSSQKNVFRAVLFSFQDVVSTTGFYNDRKIIRFADGSIEYPTLEASSKEASSSLLISSSFPHYLILSSSKLDSNFKGFHFFFCFSFFQAIPFHQKEERVQAYKRLLQELEQTGKANYVPLHLRPELPRSRNGR